MDKQAAKNVIPMEMYRDVYWKSLIYLFTNHPKLKACFNKKYIDLDERSVHIDKLKRDSRAWSASEKLVLHIALTLYNDSGKPDLSNMSLLGPENVQLVLDAMAMRYLNAPYKR